MRFTKIKYDGSTVLLTWTTKKVTGEEVRHELTSPQDPHPDFLSALDEFRPTVLELLELDEDYGSGLRVQSLSINEEKDGRIGCVVTSLKTLDAAHSPLVLNTPHLRERVDETTDRGFLSDEMMTAIARVEREAEAYVNGKRAQGDLFKVA